MIRNVGAQPVAWTCQEKNPDELLAHERRAVAARLLHNGITTMITDYPEQMRRLLNVRGKGSTEMRGRGG